MKTKTLYTVSFLIILFCGLNCKKYESFTSKKINLTFFGDQNIADKNYFATISNDSNYTKLKKQNALYEKNFLNFKSFKIFPAKRISLDFKFEKQFSSNTKKYRIVLYTYYENKKIDSTEFYRNTEVNDKSIGSNTYTSMSYLNLKDEKIWQIRYFHSTDTNSPAIISYEKSSIQQNGKIKSDSLFYLDESLDVKMERYNLYY